MIPSRNPRTMDIFTAPNANYAIQERLLGNIKTYHSGWRHPWPIILTRPSTPTLSAYRSRHDCHLRSIPGLGHSSIADVSLGRLPSFFTQKNRCSLVIGAVAISNEIKQCKAKKNRSSGPWAVVDKHFSTISTNWKSMFSARNSSFHSMLFKLPTRSGPYFSRPILGSAVEVQICETPRLSSRPGADERVSRISLADTPHSSVDDILRAFAEGRAATTSASRPSSTISKPVTWHSCSGNLFVCGSALALASHWERERANRSCFIRFYSNYSIPSINFFLFMESSGKHRVVPARPWKVHRNPQKLKRFVFQRFVSWSGLNNTVLQTRTT